VAAPILVANAGVEDINRALLDLSSRLPSASGASASSIKSVTSDYTFTATDGIIDLFVTTGASAVTVTLGRSAANKGRVLRVWKADSGIGEVSIVGNTTGSTTETVNGYSSVRAGLQYQHCDIYQDGTTNFLIGQYLQPVASEPSAGSPHPHYAVILTTDPAVTTMQTLALPAAVSGVAKRVRGRMAISSTTAGDYLQVMNAAGTERYGSATAQVNGITSESWFDAPVVGGNIYWQVNNARVTLAWLEMVSYDC
jgi:hypothetical protein